jgi:putative flippase GtrA
VLSPSQDHRPPGNNELQNSSFAATGYGLSRNWAVLNQERIFRFVRFCTVGGTVALIDFSMVFLFSRLLPPLVAVTIAYFIGVTCHFLLNKFWVFRCQRSDYLRQLLQYSVVVGSSWLITLGVVHICLSTFTSNVLIAKLCAIPCATLSGFLLMQMFVFKMHHHSNAGLSDDVSSEALAKEEAVRLAGEQRDHPYRFENRADGDFFGPGMCGWSKSPRR